MLDPLGGFMNRAARQVFVLSAASCSLTDLPRWRRTIPNICGIAATTTVPLVNQAVPFGKP